MRGYGNYGGNGAEGGNGGYGRSGRPHLDSGRPGHHIVTYPTEGPHVEPRIGSLALLLMDTLVAYRTGRRLVLHEPLAPVCVCADCHAAYTLARAVVKNAGGVDAWAAQVMRREVLDGDLPFYALLGWRRPEDQP